MARMMRVCLFLFLFAPSFAAEESRFALWTTTAIGQREATLMKNVAPDHSSRETLSDYGDHRFRLLYRDADGFPEEHDKIVDVVMVHGGEVHPLAGGDIVHIPAGIPHSFLVPAGKHITYVLLKFPGKGD
jgi:hypothetical protein